MASYNGIGVFAYRSSGVSKEELNDLQVAQRLGYANVDVTEYSFRTLISIMAQNHELFLLLSCKCHGDAWVCSPCFMEVAKPYTSAENYPKEVARVDGHSMSCEETFTMMTVGPDDSKACRLCNFQHSN